MAQQRAIDNNVSQASPRPLSLSVTTLRQEYEHLMALTCGHPHACPMAEPCTVPTPFGAPLLPFPLCVHGSPPQSPHHDAAFLGAMGAEDQEQRKATP